MAAVKERETVVIVGLKPGSQQQSQQSSASRGSPPPPPTGGGGGGGSGGSGGKALFYGFLAILLAILLSRVTADAYAVTLGNTVAAQLTAFAAWLLLILASVNVSGLLDKTSSDAPNGLLEKELEDREERIRKRFWDGFIMLVVCFHLAAYFNVPGMIPLIEATTAVVAVAHIIERKRLRYYPQSAADVADLFG
jgi:hypothetical protein